MRKLLALFLLVAVSFISSAGADDGLTVTGEKGLFTVLTADTVPDGEFSFGVHYNNIDRDPLDVDIAYYSVTFGYGITDQLEFVVAVQPYVGYDIDPKITLGPFDSVNGLQVTGKEYRDGFGDINVGAKYTFVRKENAGVGLRGYVKLPTADHDKGIGTGKADFGLDLVVSGTVGESFGLAGNVGFAFRGDPDFRTAGGVDLPGEKEIGDVFRWGVGANFPVNGNIQGIVEFTGEITSDDNAEYDDSTDLTAGLRFKFRESWYFDLGARWNVQAERDNSQYPYGGVISLSYAPGRLGRGAPPPPPPTPPPPAPPTPPPAPVTPAPPPTEFAWPEIYFPFDQYIITPESRQKLDSVATNMTDHPQLKVTIEGHCCYIGTEEYNLALGQNRADAIRDYLVAKGISADRLRTISYGESRPKYDNSKEITRRFNRRGFFVVIRPE